MVSLRKAPGNIIKPWKLPSQNVYVLSNANLVDPTEGKIHKGLTVKLSGGRVKSITSTKESSSEHQHGEINIDCTGKYLCPGLIDCHVHLAHPPGEETLDALVNVPKDVVLFRQPFVAQAMLERGFTSARDCGGASLALKEAIEEGAIFGPRLFISGHAISQTGGHGDARKSHESETLCCGGHVKGIGRIADGVAECQKAVREEIRAGADFIKIMCSGGVASPTDSLESVQYTAKEIRNMTTIATNMGTYVTAHAYTPASIKQAVENGVRGIEHGNLIDKETAQLMASKGAFLTPTLVTYATMASPEFDGFLGPANAAKNREVLKIGLNSLKLAYEAGVTICYGSDLLGPLGYTQTREFALRRQVLDAKTVLQSCTVNAAKLIRREEELGQIKEGFVADLLILTENPLENIEVLDRQEECLLAIIKDGRVYSSRWSKMATDVRRAVNVIE